MALIEYGSNQIQLGPLLIFVRPCPSSDKDYEYGPNQLRALIDLGATVCQSGAGEREADAWGGACPRSHLIHTR